MKRRISLDFICRISRHKIYREAARIAGVGALKDFTTIMYRSIILAHRVINRLQMTAAQQRIQLAWWGHAFAKLQ